MLACDSCYLHVGLHFISRPLAYVNVRSYSLEYVNVWSYSLTFLVPHAHFPTQKSAGGGQNVFVQIDIKLVLSVSYLLLDSLS